MERPQDFFALAPTPATRFAVRWKPRDEPKVHMLILQYMHLGNAHLDESDGSLNLEVGTFHIRISMLRARSDAIGEWNKEKKQKTDAPGTSRTEPPQDTSTLAAALQQERATVIHAVAQEHVGIRVVRIDANGTLSIYPPKASASPVPWEEADLSEGSSSGGDGDEGGEECE